MSLVIPLKDVFVRNEPEDRDCLVKDCVDLGVCLLLEESAMTKARTS